TLFFIVLGPMLVFYLVEDWVLFSLGILLLFGFMWTLFRALPLMWRQIHLFLNIGSVREGERIDFEDLPWLVERINVYCDLTNPVANMSLRVPINELVDLKSRPFDTNEPWFPCKKGDWVILSDGLRAKVTGISPEMVQLIERGGTRVTYPTPDFLAQSPHNLATNFRIKETLGISYSLQSQSTLSIPETLHEYITLRADEEGYGDQLLNLRVEFSEANTSSLDIVVIADFKGELGDLYNRLRRAIQRWSVDACTENDWEIPFPQMTLHGNPKYLITDTQDKIVEQDTTK
ncbi:MAG: mechanosensitive ion channel family protein, partial [Proteobacteria bacterium]|nr:mechanosensitive ion channel family protein [Pseudomonadota bacterium]